MTVPDRYRGQDLKPVASDPALPANPAASDDRLDLRMLVSIFRRRLLMFALTVAIFVLLAISYTLAQPRLYEATTDVVLNRHQGDIVPASGEAANLAPPRAEEVETEIQVIRSQKLAFDVLRTTRLDTNNAFLAGLGDADGPVARIKRWVGLAPAPVAETSEQVANRVLANLKVDRLTTAYAMRIAYRDTDRIRAAMIANAFAAAYVDSAANAKRSDNQRTLVLLRGKIDELRLQAQTDFQAVQDFRVRNNLLSAQATQLTEQEASAYGQQLAQARAGAAADRGRANHAGGEASLAVVNSPALQALKAQRAAVSIRVAEMSGRYLDSHPDLAGARRELADIDGQIASESGRIRNGVSAGLAAAAGATSQQVGALQGNLSAARGTLAANNRALVGLDDLSRKAQTSQALYDSYLKRYQEVLAQSGTERPEARVLARAPLPGAPVSPNLWLNLAFAVVLGSLVGAAGAIAAESTYSGLTTRDDVVTRLGLRYLAGIPQLSSIGLGEMTPLQSLTAVPGSAYAEAVRGMLAAIRQGGGTRHQVVAVTSALPGEGKSSLAASLARVAALAGESVILIDCDLVRRRQSEMQGIDPSRPGLREMLRDGIKLGDVMVKDAHSDAMILPITSPFPDGERLLERGHFHTMIATLREHFSLIVLDCAPILPIAEVREIVTLADTVAVCALWRKTPDSAVRSALQLLPLHAIPDIGLALTRIDMRKQARFGAGDPSFYYDKYKQYYGHAEPA